MLSNRKTIELAHLLIMYSIISLLLTAFGLFGMALYAIQQRTKEIGIRKVKRGYGRGDLVSIKSSVYRLGRDRFRDCPFLSRGIR